MLHLNLHWWNVSLSSRLDRRKFFRCVVMGLNTKEEMELIDTVPGRVRNDMNHMPQDLLEEFRILTDELLRALGSIDRQ